jgi:hypothetical protein
MVENAHKDSFNTQKTGRRWQVIGASAPQAHTHCFICCIRRTQCEAQGGVRRMSLATKTFSA